MAFEELLQHVGDRGRFQVLTTILIILLTILLSHNEFLENFTAAIPDHHCYVPLLDNPKSKANLTINLTAEALLRVSIPMGPNQKPEQCRRFRQTQWQLLDSNVSAINNTEPDTEPCLDGWIYDQSVFTSTIITEWDLVCDFQSFRYFAQAISLSGNLVGIPVNGIISDRFGRKPLLVFCCFTYAILSTCCAFAPNFSIYCILRFMSIAFLNVVQHNSTVLLLEGSPSKWQPAAVTCITLSWSVSQILLAGLAYTIRDWHMLQLALTLPFFVLLLFVCWLSESVRWLMATGKTEQALKELQRIARVNGKKDVAQSLTSEILRLEMKEEVNTTRKYFRIKEVIVNPAVCKTILLFFILWFSALFGWFGLMLDVQNLGKDIFLTLFLLGTIELPCRLLTFFVIKHINRRSSAAFSLVVFGSSVIVTIFVPKEMHILRFIIFLLGKLLFSVFTSTSVAFNNELSPTILKSTLYSISSLATKIAAVCSAFVLITRRYFVHLPIILFGSVPLAASICIYFLPETFNLPLLDTIKDLEKRYELKNKSTRKKQRKDLLRTTEC